jgi:hypothetical protein
MRHLFYKFAIVSSLLVGALAFFLHNPNILWIFALLGPLILVGLMNSMQGKHAILKNFPILGYFRYLFELIAPEIQQYFIERNTDGKPFSRNHRALVYKRAKGVNDT